MALQSLRHFMRILNTTCPKLPYSYSTIYINTSLVLSSTLLVVQCIALTLNSLSYISYPYYRIAESTTFFTISILAWVYKKYRKDTSYIFAAIGGIGIMVGFLEVIIFNNESEEGIIYWSIFGVISLYFLEFFRYYWVMALFYAVFTVYVYLRCKIARPAGILSAYDCCFYSFMSTVITCTLYYVIITTLNAFCIEKNKALQIMEAWKNMIDSIPIGIIIMTKEKILHSNSVSRSLLRDEGLEVSVICIEKLIQISDLLTTHGLIKTIKTTNNRCIYCEIKSTIFNDDIAEMLILNDISKEIESQEQKHDTKMVEMLVATSTHEMRTPLHCIKNTLQMLLEEKQNTNEEFISRAIAACDMQECYINDMLDFAKFKKNNLVIVKEPISINELIDEVRKYFIFTAKERNIKLLSIYSTQPIIIMADYMRLKQVLFNLISNAFKFTLTGEIKIMAVQDGDSIWLEVEDTGIGIKEEDFTTLFIPFRVLENSRELNKTGTGLGLFLSKKLCNLMGTDIIVKSKVDLGTKFSIKFLIDENQSSQIKKPPMNSTKSSNQLKKIRALIVDDNEFNCTILEKMLDTLNVSCIKALNGVSALDAIKSKHDLYIVFLDLNMPIMDGFQVIESIFSYYKYLGKAVPYPIFALSGDCSDNIKEICEKAGFSGFLLKPFTKNSLKTLLNSNNII